MASHYLQVVRPQERECSGTWVKTAWGGLEGTLVELFFRAGIHSPQNTCWGGSPAVSAHRRARSLMLVWTSIVAWFCVIEWRLCDEVLLQEKSASSRCRQTCSIDTWYVFFRKVEHYHTGHLT